ncbi:MAG TPA: ion channel [Bacillota bacterium]|nr:ion channel [Bacillota bacterium]
MLFFGGLLLSLMLVTMLLLIYQWFKWDWDSMSLPHRAGYCVLPWIPSLALVLYRLLYYTDLNTYKFNLALTGTFGLVVSGVNLYRSLWTLLANMQIRQTKQTRVGAGRLLLRISLAIVSTITGIVTLFGLAYALVIYLSGPLGVNYIIDDAFYRQRLAYWDFGACFYFSSVTYFALGYGDFLPRGSKLNSNGRYLPFNGYKRSI